MTYIISGSHLYGFGGLGSTISFNTAKGQGSGTAIDPFGGIGGNWGGSDGEKALRALVQGGVTFRAPPNKADKFQTGAFNGEKYVYVRGKDHGTKFYKFKVPGSGLGVNTTDDRAQKWFADTVAAATPTGGGGGGGGGPPAGGSDDVEESGAGSGATMLIVGTAVAVAAIILLKPKFMKRGASRSGTAHD